MVEVFGYEAYGAWSDVAMAAYILVNLFLLFLLMLCTCRCGVSCSDWRSKLWERRSIYSPLILQWFDQATDIGVLILWYQLALKEDNNDDFEVDHVNVTFSFLSSMVCLIFYRITIIIATCLSDNYDNRRCIPLFLSFFDLLWVYEVSFVHSQDLPELSEDMRNYQLLEAVFESVPQVVMQSVFVLRTWPNRNSFGEDFSNLYNNHEYLLLTSIVISILNIVNKYTWRDQHAPWVEPQAKTVFRYWFLHALWRFVHVLARIIMIVLMWSVLGGMVLSIFFFIVFVVFITLFNKYEYDREIIKQTTGFEPSNKEVVITAIKAFITTHLIGMTGEDTPSSKTLGFRLLLRLIEYLIGISLIWSFIEYRDSIDCPVCSSVENRDSDTNEMIGIYLYMEMASVTLDFLLFIVMYSSDLIKINNDRSKIGLNRDHSALPADAGGNVNGASGAVSGGMGGVSTDPTGAYHHNTFVSHDVMVNYDPTANVGGGGYNNNNYNSGYGNVMNSGYNNVMNTGYGGQQHQMQMQGQMQGGGGQVGQVAVQMGHLGAGAQMVGNEVDVSMDDSEQLGVDNGVDTEVENEQNNNEEDNEQAAVNNDENSNENIGNIDENNNENGGDSGGDDVVIENDIEDAIDELDASQQPQKNEDEMARGKSNSAMGAQRINSVDRDNDN